MPTHTPSTSTPAPSGLIVDTNILLRLTNVSDPQHGTAATAIAQLATDDVPLYLAPQAAYEFWVVATRPPTARGGLGWTPAQADAQLVRFEALFEVLPEVPTVYHHWRRLCAAYAVSGVPAHDARLVALWLAQRAAYDLRGLLTFNGMHFARYAAVPPLGEGIAIVDPATVSAPTTPNGHTLSESTFL